MTFHMTGMYGRAKRINERPKCGLVWTNTQRVADSHEHRCKVVPGHPNFHRCECGATKKPEGKA
jgi:hypothetical protein